MHVTVKMHLESVEGEILWWAESDGVPGFSALAPTLVELRARITAALDELVGEYTILEELVGAQGERRSDDHDVLVTA